MIVYRYFFKRIFDFLFSLGALLILSPLLLLVSLLLALANKGRIFFLQPRPGKNEKIFKIVKFKTMNDAKGEDGQLLPDHKRLTAIGRIVRKTSLDEIPQLINIVKGDMSLIGPRPLLIRYLPFYTERERLRHSVLPGVTGLAQVSGRNTLDWDERLSKDVEYVENLSFTLDFKIFVKTIVKVITMQDNYVDPKSSMQNLDEQRQKA